MDQLSSDSQNERIEAILKAGCEVTGSAIGGVMGFFLGGPVGGAAAGAIGTAAGSLLSDIATRMLSRREMARVGATAQYSIEQIQRNIEAGMILRKDFYMADLTGGRAPFEEIFEGVLIQEQSEHEEKKLRFLGQFLGNVAFDHHCSPEHANYLLGLIERLTYQQLVMLRTFNPPVIGILASENENELTELDGDYIRLRMEEHENLRDGLLECMETGIVDSDGSAANVALLELFALNLVDYQRLSPLENERPQSMNQINYALTYTTLLGTELHDLCGLAGVPIEDIACLKKIFDYTDTSWLRNF
jgi:hypothetical protein